MTKNYVRRAPPPNNMKSGYTDLMKGLHSWRLWHLMGTGELRRRYARSRIGQFWLTISTGFTVLTMALVWAIIFKASLEDILPYMATSVILWQFIAGIMSDATSLFTTSGNLLLSQRTLCSVVVYSTVYRNIITLLHNILIVPIIYVAFSVPVNFSIILAVPALILITITSVWVAYVVSIICARYRDMTNIVSSFMQLAFYVTPVIWKPGYLGENYQYLLLFNPFAYYLDILRAPIIGEPILAFNWGVVLLITFGGLLLTLAFIGKHRRRLLFWI